MNWSSTGGARRGDGRRRDREQDRRNSGSRQRRRQEDHDFDPAPPTDEDWTVGEGPSLRRLRGPESVTDALDAFLARTGFGDRLRTTRLLGDWEAIVGSDVAANSRPLRIDRGVLHLAVASTSWATQLTWLESVIIEKVNAAAGHELVRHVRITVGGSAVGDA